MGIRYFQNLNLPYRTIPFKVETDATGTGTAIMENFAKPWQFLGIYRDGAKTAGENWTPLVNSQSPLPVVLRMPSFSDDVSTQNIMMSQGPFSVVLTGGPANATVNGFVYASDRMVNSKLA